jgi:hypothetical protein
MHQVGKGRVDADESTRLLGCVLRWQGDRTRAEISKILGIDLVQLKGWMDRRTVLPAADQQRVRMQLGDAAGAP